VVFDVRPQFDLAPESYKGFEIKEPNLVAGDEEINKRLDDLRARQAMLVPLEEDRPAQTGDVVVVDYQSFEGDEPVEGGAAENLLHLLHPGGRHMVISRQYRIFSHPFNGQDKNLVALKNFVNNSF